MLISDFKQAILSAANKLAIPDSVKATIVQQIDNGHESDNEMSNNKCGTDGADEIEEKSDTNYMKSSMVGLFIFNSYKLH